MEVGEEGGLKCSGGWVKWPNSKHFLGAGKFCVSGGGTQKLCVLWLCRHFFSRELLVNFLLKMTEYNQYMVRAVQMQRYQLQ